MKAKNSCLLGAISLILAVGFSAAIITISILKVAHAQSPRRVEGAISSHVYQVDGQPISEATIQVIRMDAGGRWDATTESDGSYEVVGLPTGDYTVRAFKQGFAREYYDNVVFSR